MPIPSLNTNGELPPGEHLATFEEVAQTFGHSTDRRKNLTAGLKQAITMFQDAGVQFVLIDGSYTTDKPDPEDVDGCWSISGNLDLSKIDPAFWDFSTTAQFQSQRVTVKTRYGLDFFMAEILETGSGKPFSEFFKTNRDGDPKGILRIHLNGGINADE